MADVIELARHRSERSASCAAAPTTAPPALYFDLASPDTYLVAERVERRFGDAWWCAAVRWDGALRGGSTRRAIEAAERRAHALHMPLVWPERFPSPAPRAMRVATHAAARGRGAAFAIAAGRLAFCGGFDIEDPDILAEAAAAAGLDVGDALAAARDQGRDEAVTRAGRELSIEGGTLPALRHADRLFCGEQQITAAVLAWHVAPGVA